MTVMIDLVRAIAVTVRAAMAATIAPPVRATEAIGQLVRATVAIAPFALVTAMIALDRATAVTVHVAMAAMIAPPVQVIEAIVLPDRATVATVLGRMTAMIARPPVRAIAAIVPPRDLAVNSLVRGGPTDRVTIALAKTEER
jgi:hypothetical protein